MEEREEINTLIYEEVSDSIKEISGNKLNIFHFNIRSIKKNFNELLVYLNSFDIENISIIILSECWNLEEVRGFAINNFEIYYNESKFNQNDGCVVYVRKNLNHNITITPLSQINLLRVLFEINNIHFGLTVSYRPPATNVGQFIVDLDEYFRNIKKEKVEIFAGDININTLEVFDINVNNYLDILTQNGFKSYINKPTRVTETTSTIIDHIFVRECRDLNKDRTNVEFKPILIKTSLTDHYSVILSVNVISNTTKHKLEKTEQKFINYNQLCNVLENETWANVYNTDDVEIAYNNFNNTLSTHIQNCSKIIKKHSISYKIKPWMTNGLLNSIKHKDKLKAQLIQNFSEERKVQFNKYRNKLNKLIKTTKDEYYKKQIIEAQNNYKKIWNIINDATDSKNKNCYKKIGDIINDKGECITNAKLKTTLFNNFFVNVGNELAKNIKPDRTENLNVNRLPNSFYLTPITDTEIILHINNLKNNTSPGPDGLSVKVLKITNKYIKDPLSYIINLVFLKNKLPTAWKTSIVTPIFKYGDSKKTTNYRPISLINNTAKIFEYCLKKRLIDYLEKYHILHKHQYGFRKNFSTEHAVHELINIVINGLDNNKKCLAIFMDLSKAFDTVNHEILLAKLDSIGIRGSEHRLFRDYLTDRTQRVKIDNVISEPLKIITGVPQGTVIGPILFLIYINNLLNSNINGHKISYADDTSLIFTDDTWEKVYNKAEKGLKIIKKWLDNNLLSLNVQKTKFMAFSLLSNDQPKNDNIFVHDVFCKNNLNCNCGKVMKVNEIKYLGLMIDHHLRWNVHAMYVVKRLRRLMYKFYQLRDILNKKNLLIIYNALIESILRYCITVWGGSYKNALKNLQVIQNSIIKIILKKNYRYSTDLLYTETGLFNVRLLYIYQALQWMTNIIDSNQENVLLSFPYNTRSVSNQNIETPAMHKSHTQRHINFLGPKLYNLLPLNLKSIRKKQLLKKTLRIYLQENHQIFENVFNA